MCEILGSGQVNEPCCYPYTLNESTIYWKTENLWLRVNTLLAIYKNEIDFDKIDKPKRFCWSGFKYEDYHRICKA